MAKRRLVVIDDDPAFREVMAAALAEEFEVKTAADAETGIAACRELAPALVLLDLCMPRVNGIKVARELHREEATRGIPVLVCSAAYVEPGARLELGLLGNVRRVMDKLSALRQFQEAARALAAA